MEDFSGMTTREEILKYGMTFPEVYQDTPFRSPLVKDMKPHYQSTFPINR